MTIILSIILATLYILIWYGLTSRKEINRIDREFASLLLRCIDWSIKNKRKNYDYGYHMGKIYNALWFLKMKGLVSWLPVTKNGTIIPLDTEVILFKTGKGFWNFGIDGVRYVISMNKKLFEKALDEDTLEMNSKLAKEIKKQCK